MTLQFLFLGIDTKFQILPRSRFFYSNTRFLRISTRLPKGTEPINVVWRKDGRRITKTTHPTFSPTRYRGPVGFLYHALDIRASLGIAGLYSVTTFNLGGIVQADFRLILAGNISS